MSRISLRRAVLPLAGSMVFLLLARRAATGDVSAAEERAFRAINELSPTLRTPAWFVMQAGSLAAVPVVAAVALPKHRATAIALAADGTAVWGLCKLIKRVIKRGRPADCLDDVVVCGKVQRGRGFPSGHAAVATTLTTIGVRLLPKRAARLAWAAPVLVCVGRQFVGAHLPLDVAGGATFGLSVGSLTNLALDAASPAAL